MQFPIQDHYIHMSRHRKATISSYVCNDLEWETAYEQAPKKVFNIIFLKEERERKLQIFSSLGESNGFPL